MTWYKAKPAPIENELIFILSWLLCLMFAPQLQAQPLFPHCSEPILSRLQSHQIAAGETLTSIAAKYNLLPETLIKLNPVLEEGALVVGTEILIPPINGVRVEVPAGATWKDLQAAYSVGADVLFEMNGCEDVPREVFIPGVTWRENNQGINKFPGYPLPAIATVGLAYGWQSVDDKQRVMFHSGIDLLSAIGTQVLAVDQGVVAFIGQEENYGYLVVVDHGKGVQTRYAHLSKIVVAIGAEVNAGDVIAAVGNTGQPDLKVPHLHFEVRQQLPVGWVAQDPLYFISY
ncbi:MAG: M23 family metallopeptidase [Gomphosphaeria aponina SAG 52.96 = DSM 107014]|uniref:M23 family metallopeptidase n=1 Tax=Gomphosphaeria aponina SAG 52.96 = DSM 107014 TaxID=1521640 RepID=A0A941JPG5_9CHRO|nr:M23 family metallopeptidase [Gomphosphaeria aponina SAG 52.96 = DSM 107014]